MLGSYKEQSVNGSTGFIIWLIFIGRWLKNMSLNLDCSSNGKIYNLFLNSGLFWGGGVNLTFKTLDTNSAVVAIV
jgi:hypothetical protein